MAESQNGVTTDAITALIAAILALANDSTKKACFHSKNIAMRF
jgi:hypothetical protein